MERIRIVAPSPWYAWHGPRPYGRLVFRSRGTDSGRRDAARVPVRPTDGERPIGRPASLPQPSSSRQTVGVRAQTPGGAEFSAKRALELLKPAYLLTAPAGSRGGRQVGAARARRRTEPGNGGGGERRPTRSDPRGTAGRRGGAEPLSGSGRRRRRSEPAGGGPQQVRNRRTEKRGEDAAERCAAASGGPHGVVRGVPQRACGGLHGQVAVEC